MRLLRALAIESCRKRWQSEGGYPDPVKEEFKTDATRAMNRMTAAFAHQGAYIDRLIRARTRRSEHLAFFGLLELHTSEEVEVSISEAKQFLQIPDTI